MPLMCEVAVPVPLARAFSYEVPVALAEQVRPGTRVLCEFGRKKVLGVVLATSEGAAPEGVRLKPIVRVVDAEPVLPAELLVFLKELAAYYFAPIGEVLRLALPAMERESVREMQAQGELVGTLGRVKQVGGKRIAFARATDVIEEPGKLRGQTAAVLSLLRANGEAPVARLEEQFGNARNAVKKLASLGLVVVEDREAPRDAFFALPEPRDAPPELNEAQTEATTQIEKALVLGKQSAFLLFGVTGSGKTEVYLRAIAACLAQGRSAIVMVPEIALTPQFVARFRARFGDDLGVLHSGLSEADRHAMWKRLRSGGVLVSIGARSSIFAPVSNLGLVIVDEEHDGSFKQEEGVRYHARDMALLRAFRANAVAVLGSATPSLETVDLVRRGKLTELRLPERAHKEATLPMVSTVDLRRIGAGPTGNKLLSLPLHRAIEATLAAQEQVILFLNRRGFAPSVVCEGCGEVATCLGCSVALTYHKSRGGRLRCHYCDWEGPMPSACSSCQSPALGLEGLGTERLEETIASAFPNARVARLDRDVADGVKAEEIMSRMRAREIDILVGTQMVTKGHDIATVTLVGVLNADAALSLPDFRASERGFQLLVQVAGRAGRRDRPGRVIIQTRSPEHPAIRFAMQHDVRGFLNHEIQDRAEVGYPPFRRLTLFRIDALDEETARRAAGKIAAHARTSPEGASRAVEVLGPAVAPIARLRGRFRFRVLLRSADRRALRQAALAAMAAFGELDNRVRVVVDVDPVSML
jgi:primosomal protein N' (replication factor Y) (superfamily II helicase)